MSHDARAVANSLIEKGRDAGRPLTPLQIIKLVYFCHGWMLGLYHKPLIEQDVEAWLYGPVVAQVYRGLKKYGGHPVTITLDVPNVPKEEFDETEADLIEQVHGKYGHLPGMVLSQLTHAPGTPWYLVWHGKERNLVIPNDLIEAHYAEKANAP